MKTMLITGATSGIGQALAQLAADSGFAVIACGRNADALNALAEHPHITTRQFDITDKAATAESLSGLQPDIAVLNAGTCEYVDADDFDIALFERVFNTNVFGVINCVGALINQLGEGSQLVIIDSMARLLPFTRAQAYGASKAAVHYLSESLAVDVKDKGILVQSVSPGFVDTPLTEKNDFSMPMVISVEQAAERLLSGIIKRKPVIYFPTRFGLMLRTLNLLPARIQRLLSGAMRQTQ